MKRILLTLLLTSTLFAADDPATAEKKTDDHTPIVLDYQFVSVPKAVALGLRKKLSADDTDAVATAAAARELEQLIVEGKAEVLAAPILRTTDNVRVVSEDHDEVRYATYYDTPLIVESDSFQPAGVRANGLELGGVPTEFESRKTGFIVEAQPNWDPKTGEVRIYHTVTHTYLSGNRKTTIEKQPGDVKVTVEQPSFRTNRSQGTVSLKPGATALVGFFRDPANEQRMEMVTITVYREAKK